MSDWLLDHEAPIRLAAFLGIFALLILAQRLWPRRDVPGGWQRSTTNLALVIIDTAVLRFAFPLLAVDLALTLEENDSGLLNRLPAAYGVIAGLLILDVAIYWQHRLFHMIPILWRLHRVHHADVGFDVSTGVRFHPLEIVLSMGIKLGIIFLLGIPALAVLIFEIVLNAGSLFTHSNLYLPKAFERHLRWLFVTPEMHRVHHSWYDDETNSNFGFHLSVWDRIFTSYRDQPRDGHREMTIGLKEFRERDEQTLGALLVNPFRDEKREPSTRPAD